MLTNVRVPDLDVLAAYMDTRCIWTYVAVRYLPRLAQHCIAVFSCAESTVRWRGIVDVGKSRLPGRLPMGKASG